MLSVKVGDARIRFVLATLDEAPKTSVSRLAELLDLSCSQLEFVFKREVGESIRDYRRELRLQRAEHLIVTTTIPLKEIPDRCGLPDLSNLNRSFKRRYGMPPARYRRERGHSSESRGQ